MVFRNDYWLDNLLVWYWYNRVFCLWGTLLINQQDNLAVQ